MCIAVKNKKIKNKFYSYIDYRNRNSKLYKKNKITLYTFRI